MCAFLGLDSYYLTMKVTTTPHNNYQLKTWLYLGSKIFFHQRLILREFMISNQRRIFQGRIFQGVLGLSLLTMIRLKSEIGDMDGGR